MQDKLITHNVEGLAFVAEFGKRQPGLLRIENTKVDDKNCYLALFVTPKPKPMVR
jgi:hypothetical protein